MAMEVTHYLVHQGWCKVCGTWTTAQVPAEQSTGYGPRCSARLGAIAETHGSSLRTIQNFCASVLRMHISLSAIQKELDRVAQAGHRAALHRHCHARVPCVRQRPR
jgi:hypothetical protein